MILLLLLCQDVREDVEKIVAASGLKEARIGIHLWSEKAGLLYAKDDDRPFTLASNTKLLTCAAALDRLGPDYRYETVAWTAGNDLVVTGTGDPNLSGRFFADDPAALFRKWAGRKFADVVLVNEGFDGETICPGWKRYDLWNWWAAPFGTFSLNDNCVDVRIEPGEEGKPAKISIVPDTKYVTIVNRTVSVKKSSKPWGVVRKDDEITVTGEVAGPATTWVAVRDPYQFYGTVLRETTGATGSIRIVRERPGGLTEIGRHSTDLAVTLKVCLSVSQNFYAETLLRTLGREKKGLGSRENGLAVVREFLKEAGVSAEQSDGSGLTRENRATPADLVALLRHMRAHRHAGTWMESLAVNGAEKGTLRKRMTEKDVAGRVRAKTGHISGVSALSGYLETKGGDTVVFSILVNDWKSGNPDRFQDRLCEFLIRR